MLYRSETWSVKYNDVVTLERNDARMIGRRCSNRPDNGISVRNRL